jgi:hypothetical protein
MTKTRAALRFLLAVAASGLNSLRRALKRLAAPGTGPFLSGVRIRRGAKLTRLPKVESW